MNTISGNRICKLAILGLVPITLSFTTPANTAIQSYPALSQTNNQVQLAQNIIGYCIVADPSETPLNVRQKPNGKVIGSLKNGTIVALGETDGSEGEKWTKIIKPLQGYVWSDYLKDCK
ncbi:MAG: SH3 domain-containing protein [Planktothrix sp.]